MKKQNTKLPAWFQGMQYDKGDTVKNKFSGEEYELNSAELSMYDFVIGSQLVFEMAPRSITQNKLMTFKKVLTGLEKITLKPIWFY
jgi:hypothetical protein